MKYYIQTTAFATLLLLSACGDDSRLQGNLPEGTDPDAPIEFPVTRSTTGGKQYNIPNGGQIQKKGN